MIQMTNTNSTKIQKSPSFFGVEPKKVAHNPKTTMGDKKTLPLETKVAGAKSQVAKGGQGKKVGTVSVARALSGKMLPEVKASPAKKALSVAQGAALAKKKADAAANQAARAKTVFTFKKMPAKDEKLAPQALRVLEMLKDIKKGTLAELCDALTKSGKLKTVQTPERIVTFYRKELVSRGYVTVS